MLPRAKAAYLARQEEFQWAPTLGGECYKSLKRLKEVQKHLFQWAPTLGGECYGLVEWAPEDVYAILFQWAPTLGGECYEVRSCNNSCKTFLFQWAPTLGGECYQKQLAPRSTKRCGEQVSMGTHPWG